MMCTKTKINVWNAEIYNLEIHYAVDSAISNGFFNFIDKYSVEHDLATFFE